ncbi:MAG: hypothetical protein IT374_18795 [Polyangiaceae bacterium]|nr:hypothetical protein [Polyangiaceae bacterium]
MRRLLPHLLALSVAAAAGCKDTPSLGPAPAASMAPVPEPAGLVAEVMIPKPGQTWARLRTLVGGPAAMLPQSFGMGAAMLLGLSPKVAELIDAEVPAVGAVTSDGKVELAVLAIHVRDGQKVIDDMTAGPQAKHLARVDAVSKVTLIEPKPGETSLNASMGVTGNFLLLAYAPDALLKVGPYAARTVSTRAMPPEDVVVVSRREALGGPVRARVRGWWSEAKKTLEEADQRDRERHGGAAPTFADPKAAVAKADQTFTSLFALLGDLSEARVALTVDDAGAHVASRVVPGSKDGPASIEIGALTVGDARPLAELPEEVSLAMLSRDSQELRKRGADDQLVAIDNLFQGKLGDDDKKRVRALLDTWSQGRGDWIGVGASFYGERRVFGRVAVADAKLFDQSVKGTVELLKVPAFREPLKHWLGELKLAPAAELDGGAGTVIKVVRTPPAPAKKPDPSKDKSNKLHRTGTEKQEPQRFDVAWSISDATASFVMSDSGRDSLRDLAKARDGGLGADPEIKRALEAVKGDAAFVLLVLPMRTIAGLMMARVPKEPPPPAPIVLSLGRKGSDGYLQIDASTLAVRELAKIRSVQ